MTTLANTVSLFAAVFLTSDAVIAQTPQKSSAQSSPQFQVGVHLSRATPDSGPCAVDAQAHGTLAFIDVLIAASVFVQR